jgi:hypothetical protein
MKFFNKNFIKVPHLSFVDAIREGGRNPFVDWIMILLISGVIALVSVVNSVLLYKKIVEGSFQRKDVVENTKSKIFEKNDLIKIINNFDKKNNIHNQIKNGANVTSVPVL